MIFIVTGIALGYYTSLHSPPKSRIQWHHYVLYICSGAFGVLTISRLINIPHTHYGSFIFDIIDVLIMLLSWGMVILISHKLFRSRKNQNPQ